MRRSLLFTVMALAAVWGWACDASEPEPGSREPLVPFDTIEAAIITASDSLPITAELADTGDRRAYGLMERDSLPEDHGMLFVYPTTREPAGGFWMYRTLIPLDIAFLDDEGVIVAILAMEPCRSPNPDLCRRYSPGVPYRGALEMEQGYFDAHGVGTGDRVLPAPAEVPAVR